MLLLTHSTFSLVLIWNETQYFWVATTERTRWTCIPVDPGTVSRLTHHWPHCMWERASESKSQLAVMKFPQEYSEMELIKVIDNLVTEEIKYVRFSDDKAYLFTFMRVRSSFVWAMLFELSLLLTTPAYFLLVFCLFCGRFHFTPLTFATPRTQW